MSGWIDNFNGPAGLIVGNGKGLVRVLYSDPNNILDHVPVDITAKAIIISSWKQAINKYILSVFLHRTYKSVLETQTRDSPLHSITVVVITV